MEFHYPVRCALFLRFFPVFSNTCLRFAEPLLLASVERGRTQSIFPGRPRVYGDSSFALAAWDPTCSWKNGDTVMLGTERLEIAGLLKYDPFRSDGLTGGQLTLIVSDETFARLTGITDYALLMIQTSADVPDETVEAIRQLAEENGCP